MQSSNKEQSLKEQLQQKLLESYKPRTIKDDKVTCVVCGTHGVPMYFHVIEYSQNEGLPFPQGFVLISVSNGRVRGCFPFCTTCLKQCKKCELAIPSEIYHEKLLELQKKHGCYPGFGQCKHMRLSLFFHALIKRIFKIGRFSKKTIK